jgi:TolB-like protein
VSMWRAQFDSGGRYRLGDLELDIDRHRLSRRGRTIDLPKLTFRALTALASAAPNLVSKDELGERVWDGRPVSQETVAQRIKLLRKALQDDAQDPRYVKVVRGEGYCWLTEVTAEAQPARSAEFLGDPESADGVDLSLPSQPSIAILPLELTGRDGIDDRIFGDGLTHDIITDLGRARWLFVVARGSSFKFRGEWLDVRDLGRRLGVRYIVQGTVSMDGNRVTVRVALTDAVEAREIWAEKFYGKRTDIFRIREKIVRRIVASAESEISHAEQRRSLLKAPSDLDAWSAYHRGWWHLNSFAPDCFDKAERYFGQSLRHDPTSARATAGLSCVHWLRGFLEISDDRSGEIDKCLELAHMSVQLDARDPLARWTLGRAYQLNRDFEQSLRQFDIANELNPNFALGRFAQAFSMMLAGQHEQSNRLLNTARRLSPYDTMSYAMLGVQAVNNAMLGRFDVAADLSVRGARLLTFYCQMFPVIAAYCNVLDGKEELGSRYFAELRDSRPGYSRRHYFRAFPHQADSDVARINSAFDVLEAHS